MRLIFRCAFVSIAVFACVYAAAAQADEICGETGGTVWMNSSYVFGKIHLNGFDRAGKLPKITVTLSRSQRDYRFTIGWSGNYCFRDVDGGGGTLIVDIEGVEVGRQTLPASGLIKQHRQDFDVYDLRINSPKPPGTVSAKYVYPRTEQNAKLFEEAAAAEKARDFDRSVKLLKEIVAADPADFLAWARLGSIFFDRNDHSAAASAYKKALEAKPDLAPAMMNLGRISLIRQDITAAIEILDKATQTDPTLARAFQLLGEAYLLDRKGTLGVKALNEAIRLDPIGMAECHLLMATLYDRAGAKSLASREYALFLEKVPEHADKDKFKAYIKKNPPE